jgi:hypothetical protein
MKKCSKCGSYKLPDSFQKDNQKSDGLYSRCKECVAKFNRRPHKKYSEYTEEQKLAKKAANKRYEERNRMKVRARKLKYYYDNKQKCLNTQRVRKQSSPLLKLSCNIRSRMHNSLYRVRLGKKSKTSELLGCSFLECKNYIQGLMQDGMTWDNYGMHTWHIDHIVPLSSAKTEEDLLKLFNYKNLQPLWAKDNLSKSNKIQ